MKGKITLIQILLIFVIVICVVTYLDEHSEKNKDIQKVDEIKTEELIDDPIAEETSTTSDDAVEENNINRINELKERNADAVGWIKLFGTAIDYPVLHNTQSNAYYLHRNIDKEYSSSGIPFLDYQCKADLSDDNTIIYGHNMRNGTMFHDLLKYSDKSFYDTHKLIRYDTAIESGTYEIFAVLRTKVGSKNEFKYYNFIKAKTPSEYDEFVAICIKLSLYKTDIIPKYGDKLLTLSTCSYNTDNERFVVFAKKINV